MSLTQALARLFDDASQFPPGNLPLEPAWEAHLRWRRSAHAPVVGRFLVPAARATALADLIGEQPVDGVELGLVLGAERPEGLERLIDGPAAVTSVELRGAKQVDDAWPAGATLFIEGVPVQTVAELRKKGPSAVCAKLRCGGLAAAAFPTPEAVASFVAECAKRDVPFKATAGLHGPLRHWDPEIGTYHHGFLNLWAATALAVRGADQAELIECLTTEDVERLWGMHISSAELEQARRLFLGFGTCSIDEPLEGLRDLGLLDD